MNKSTKPMTITKSTRNECAKQINGHITDKRTSRFVYNIAVWPHAVLLHYIAFLFLFFVFIFIFFETKNYVCFIAAPSDLDLDLFLVWYVKCDACSTSYYSFCGIFSVCRSNSVNIIAIHECVRCQLRKPCHISIDVVPSRIPSHLLSRSIATLR